MGPIDYSLNVATPFQSALQGYQVGAGIRNDQLQSQQQQAELQQQQAKIQAQRQQQELLANLAANPNAGADDYTRVMTQIPALAENLSKVWKVKDTAQQQAHASSLLQWGAAIKSGQPQIAVQQMRDRATALEAAGDKREADALRANAGVLEQNPAMGLGVIQAQLAASPLGKDAAESLAKFGGEQRSAELHPSALSASQSGAVKAEADARTAQTGAKFAESKAVQDLNLGQAQIAKMAADTEIAKMNSRIAAMNAATSREGNDLKRQELGLKIEEAIQKRDTTVREKVADYQAGQATLQDAMGLIGEIRSNQTGLRGATGASSWGAFMPGTPARTVAGKIEQLQNTLAASNLDKLKGAMSDKDILFLKNIATNLDRGQDEGAFLKELEKIEGTLIRSDKMLRQKFGNAASTPVPSAEPAAPKAQAAGGSKQRNVTVDW